MSTRRQDLFVQFGVALMLGGVALVSYGELRIVALLHFRPSATVTGEVLRSSTPLDDNCETTYAFQPQRGPRQTGKGFSGLNCLALAPGTPVAVQYSLEDPGLNRLVGSNTEWLSLLALVPLGILALWFARWRGWIDL